MSKFLDNNGNETAQITTENLSAYKNWIYQAEKPETRNLIIAPEVSLADVISQALTKEQKSAVADIISRTLAYQCDNVRRNEFIDLANNYGDVVSIAWKRMGCVLANQESEYMKVLRTINERVSSKNLGFALAVIKAGDGLYNAGKPDDFGNLSAEERASAEKILDIAAKGNNDTQGYLAIKYVECLLENGSMLNMKTSPRNREIINEALLRTNSFNRIALLEKVKPEYFNIKMVRVMLAKYGNVPQFKDVSKAKTQAEKNANIMPQGYHIFKKAVLHLVEQQNKYDRSNYGDERGLNERYLEVCKTLELSDELSRSPKAMAGLYLETARKDIEQGRFNRLDEKSLSDVLKNDDGRYLAMFPKEFVEKNKQFILNSLTKKLRRKLIEQNVSEMTYGIASLGERDRTTEENAKILASLSDEQAKLAPRKEELQQYKADSEKEQKQIELMYNLVVGKHESAEAVKLLQSAFAQINNYRKKDGSKAEETVLSAQAVEQILTDRLQGKKSVLPAPEHGSLPLMFGRKEEKTRREKLSEKISQFNELLDKAMPKIDVRYSGEILTQAALNDALMSESAANQEYSNANRDYQIRQDNIGKHKERELDELIRRDNDIEQARTRILAKEAKKKEAVKYLIGVPDKTAVQTISQNTEKAEKAQVRRRNRQVEDKLEIKEKEFAGKSDSEKVELQKNRQISAIFKSNNEHTI